MQNQLCYILKATLSDYRVYKAKEETVDPETGELTREWYQRKRPLRPGDALKVARVISGRKLPELLFATGQGIKSMQATLAAVAAGIAKLSEIDDRSQRRSYYGVV